MLSKYNYVNNYTYMEDVCKLNSTKFLGGKS